MITLLVALIGLGTATAVGANATIEPSTVGASTAAVDEHCVQQVGQGASLPGPVTCFTTYGQVVSYLSNGQVTYNGTAENFTSTVAGQISAAASQYILSVEYEDSRFRGKTNTLTASSSCAGSNPVKYLTNMHTGWNNVIGSSKAFSNCGARHYDAAGATATNIPAGAVYVCTADCSQLGAMNDATSSMRWT